MQKELIPFPKYILEIPSQFIFIGFLSKGRHLKGALDQIDCLQLFSPKNLEKKPIP